MARISLNPKRGLRLKDPFVKIRRSIKGKRRTVRVNYKDILYESESRVTVDGKSHTYSPYDLKDLVGMPKGKVGEFLFTKGNTGFSTREEAYDALGEALFKYNRYNMGPGFISVAYIYSRKSRVIRGTANMWAVRLKNGMRGWLDTSGTFHSESEFRELLHNVDQTSPAALSDISLLDAYDALSTQGKADLFEAFKDFDWDVFWEDIGSDDPERDLGTAVAAYDAFVDKVGELLGW